MTKIVKLQKRKDQIFSLIVVVSLASVMSLCLGLS